MADPEPYLTADAAVERDRRLAGEEPAEVEAAVAAFEVIAERARGVAFTPRERTIVPRHWKPGVLRLPDVEVRSVSAVVVDDIAQPGPTTGVIYPDRLGDLLAVSSAWSAGATSRSVTVTYSHGLDEPPPVILDACTEYVLCTLRAKASGVSRNTLSVSTEAGTTRYSTPDWAAGRFTGFLEVDRLINSAPDFRTPGIG